MRPYASQRTLTNRLMGKPSAIVPVVTIPTDADCGSADSMARATIRANLAAICPRESILANTRP